MRSKRKPDFVCPTDSIASMRVLTSLSCAKHTTFSFLIVAFALRIRTVSIVKKETKGADGKVTVAFVPEITRYKVICGSNGKVGTRYNVIKIPKEEKGRVIRKTVIDNGTVGRRLTDEEFVNMYPSQCNIFKEIFKEEFQVASQKIQKTKR